ncbi:MAG: XkdW family protein [Pseudomonadota bacterium]
MNIAQAILHLYPDMDPLHSFRVQDDGAGPYLAAWHDPRPQPTPAELEHAWVAMHPPRTKQNAATDKQTAIDQHANAIRAQITAGVSKAEMAGWYRKEREARAYKASGLSTDAPSLDAEATARGVTLAALVDLVIAKADRLAALEAQIAGTAGRHSDAVDALLADPASTVEQIDAYDYTSGWPL